MENMGFMKAFLAMGNMMGENDSIEKKVAYKEKIVFATMRSAIPNWEEPRDWATLTAEKKLERLEKIENMNL